MLYGYAISSHSFICSFLRLKFVHHCPVTSPLLSSPSLLSHAVSVLQFHHSLYDPNILADLKRDRSKLPRGSISVTIIQTQCTQRARVTFKPEIASLVTAYSRLIG